LTENYLLNSLETKLAVRQLQKPNSNLLIAPKESTMSLQVSESQAELSTSLHANTSQIVSTKRYPQMRLVEKANPIATINQPAKSSGILGIVGNTPLVQLSRIYPDAQFKLFAKLEMFNPGGSVKDRPAVNMLKQAFERGDIVPGSTIVESSSGNLGIGLAQACILFGLRFICVVDPKTTQQNLSILKAYGAEVNLVSEPDPITGDFLPARISRVKSLLADIPNSFWLNQYANINNAKAHHQTMHEIVRDLDGELDYLFLTTGSCGTLRGCSDYIKSHNLKTKIVAIDAKGSVIFGDKRGKRLIPGHGAAQVPALLLPGLESEHMHVTDRDCLIGCRRLLHREAILAGGSAGGAISAVGYKAAEIPVGSNCAVILCDRGERYLDTVYSDSWVKENFGEIDWN
jgi:N-(2-amino-2-carboxyethyl)-L-glutamate synthase